MQKVLIKLIIPIVCAIAIGILVAIVMLSINNKRALENQTYSRYIACALSIPVEERTRERIEDCWDNVQQDMGIRVKRYDQI